MLVFSGSPGALIGARRCSSAKRRAAFTSLADSDPGHREARAGQVQVQVRQHDKLLRDTSDSEPYYGGIILYILPAASRNAPAARRAGLEKSKLLLYLPSHWHDARPVTVTVTILTRCHGPTYDKKELIALGPLAALLWPAGCPASAGADQRLLRLES